MRRCTLAFALAMSCGDNANLRGDGGADPDGPTAADASAMDAIADGNTGDGSVIPVVPDPGQMPFVWADTEPNDTPEQAVPMGIADAGFWAPYNFDGHLGGADTADYFVFRSSNLMTMATFVFCWDLPVVN